MSAWSQTSLQEAMANDEHIVQLVSQATLQSLLGKSFVPTIICQYGASSHTPVVQVVHSQHEQH